MGELSDGNPFKIEQIYCIQKVLRYLIKEQIEMFYTNPVYNGKINLKLNTLFFSISFSF